MERLCECGCGRVVKNRFALGHRLPMDRVGQTFGNWKVISAAKPVHYECKTYTRFHRRWLCECQCVKKTKKTVSDNQLMSGGGIECCSFRWTNGKAAKRPYEALFNLLIHAAKHRGIPADLTYEQFLIFTSITSCHYCGEVVSWKKYDVSRRGHRYNLDRKDNGAPYTSDNLVVCCKRCNYAKGRWFSYEEWMAMTAALRSLKCLIG